MPTTQRPQRDPRLQATMTGAEFQTLRKHMQLSVRDLAHLLAVTEQTIRNIESTYGQHPSRTIERFMVALLDPDVRQKIQAIADGKQETITGALSTPSRI